jgi:hypothetical protein
VAFRLVIHQNLHSRAAASVLILRTETLAGANAFADSSI